MGDSSFIKEARAHRDRSGLKLWSMGPLALSCEMKLHQALTQEPSFYSKLLWIRAMVQNIQALARSKAPDSDTARIYFDPPVPESCMVHVYLQ